MDHINPDGKDLSGKKADIALLHVYGPYTYHDQVMIVGNTEGLMRLLDVIRKALTNDAEQDRAVSSMPINEAVFHTDGEGYQVVVIRQDADWQSKEWDEMLCPYTDENYATGDTGVHPLMTLSKEELEIHLGVKR
jgi:hypothetical protein